MWNYPEHYDLIVIGGGHAGCEAAHAAARIGVRTLLLTMSLDTIGKMSCNPAIGGTAKGHLVREIDALGGIMGKIADRTAIQKRMLNASKGPAVWSPRVQSDRFAYQLAMKEALELIPNLFLLQGTIESLIIEDDHVRGVNTQEGMKFTAPTVVITSGTFMRGLMHIGEINFRGGRAGDKASVGLSAYLENLGFKFGRLKTGTPPRIHKRSIDFSQLEEQHGDPEVRFSFDPSDYNDLPQVPCHITYTTAESKKIVKDNLNRSSLYSGNIQGTPTRYCPSIEDKIVRFADKERHQIFLEPEGLTTNEYYVNGISSSLPFDIQYALIRSVTGLENAEIMRPAYAIEYDYLLSGQLKPTLESRQAKGLFFAGQINGTTGYEEAAAQGLIAGINAANQVLNKPDFYLTRAQAYIGVMIDDLSTKELDEPYRVFTSRAEHRLLLRQDNADLRLREEGYHLGLISKEQYQYLIEKKQRMKKTQEYFDVTHVPFENKSISLSQLLRRPEISYQKLLNIYPDKIESLDAQEQIQIEFDFKYSGYIKKQEKIIERMQELEQVFLPSHLNFKLIKGLRLEAQDKLDRFRPLTLSQASRIAGVSPADISVLMIFLKNPTQQSILQTSIQPEKNR